MTGGGEQSPPLFFFAEGKQSMRGVRALALAAACLSAAIALGIGPGQPFDDDDPGCVPDTSDHRKCSGTLAKAFAKLIAAVTSCHDRQARAAFGPLAHRGARDRYSIRALRLIVHGGCPPCLDSTQQQELAVRTMNQVDADNARLYPCP